MGDAKKLAAELNKLGHKEGLSAHDTMIVFAAETLLLDQAKRIAELEASHEHPSDYAPEL
jgi:hypothetical protein